MSRVREFATRYNAPLYIDLKLEFFHGKHLSPYRKDSCGRKFEPFINLKDPTKLFQWKLKNIFSLYLFTDFHQLK